MSNIINCNIKVLKNPDPEDLWFSKIKKHVISLNLQFYDKKLWFNEILWQKFASCNKATLRN